MSLKAEDIMQTEFLSIAPQATIRETIDILLNNKVSSLVVQENEEILGIINVKDLLVAYNFIRNDTNPIQEFIVENFIKIDEKTSFNEILRLFIQENLNFVFVHNCHGRICGSITAHDILRSI